MFWGNKMTERGITGEPQKVSVQHTDPCAGNSGPGHRCKVEIIRKSLFNDVGDRETQKGQSDMPSRGKEVYSVWVHKNGLLLGAADDLKGQESSCPHEVVIVESKSYLFETNISRWFCELHARSHGPDQILQDPGVVAHTYN